MAVDPEPPTAPPPTVPEPVAQPDPPPEPDPPVEPVPEPSPAPPVDPGPLIEVVGGEPVDGVKRIKVKNGETARFSVASDAPAEVHVHGLEVTKNVGPEKDVKFKLETSFEGIFEIELHGPAGDVEIAKLVIEPK